MFLYHDTWRNWLVKFGGLEITFSSFSMDFLALISFFLKFVPGLRGNCPRPHMICAYVPPHCCSETAAVHSGLKNGKMEVTTIMARDETVLKLLIAFRNGVSKPGSTD